MSLTVLLAQEPADALRFSWTTQGGTARQQAIGGAMGSLGGDLSSIYTNPAGLAFYRTGDLVFSPAFRFGDNKATYLNRTEKEKNKNFVLGTSGFVIGSSKDRKFDKSIAIGIAVNRTADFNSNILYRGATNESSYSQKFLEEINNGNIKDANRVATGFPYGTSLAFNTFWIDTVGGGTNGNYTFKSRAPLATGILQEQQIYSSGGITEFAIGGGVNINDKIMLGGTFAIPLLNYNRESTFTEVDATTNKTNNFESASFTENLNTKGAGINIKAGFIFKPVDYVRIGFALHSPTLYNLTDLYSASITTNTEGYQGNLSDYSVDYNSGDDAQFKYTLITPFKAVGSISYVLREVEDVTKQKGFITADVEYVNYKGSSFEPDEESINDQDTKNYLKSLNRAIDNSYKSSLNFRVGGELKFTTLMVRAGAVFYGNPYVNINGEKGSKLNLSGGLGYRNKGKFIDLTYVHAMGKDVHFPYRLENSAYNGASIKSTNSNVLVTVG
ncbi:MAG TPA: hypothetical protein VM888_15615, partial [Chitinophagaceae bacterium]|nr:hypothetical protein [Chitinophagaceae bacterium]